VRKRNCGLCRCGGGHRAAAGAVPITQVQDDQPTRFHATVRYFFAGIVVVVIGVVMATIVA
jgi:hypothetical protein